MSTCRIDGCTKASRVRNLCPMHYQRLRIHGSTSYTKPLESSDQAAERFWSRVTKTDGCWVWAGRRKASGYGSFTLRAKDYVAHRVAYQLTVGPIPEGKLLDHICHNRACVNPKHLRLATHKQNAENRASANRTSQSGIRGVSIHGPSGKWVGQMTHNYTRHVKYFDTKEEAAAFVAAKRQELFTHSIERVSR